MQYHSLSKLYMQHNRDNTMIRHNRYITIDTRQ